MLTKKNLKKHELIGLRIKVMRSSNRTQEGTEGKVVDETQNTFRIERGNREKIVQKRGSVFMFTLPAGEKVKVSGDEIAFRPEERIRKR